MTDTDYQVFISYSSKEAVIANGIVKKLQAAGIQSWIAPRDIPIGRDYTAAISDGINCCPVYLVLLSHNSIASAFVKKEMVQAVNQNRYIMPLLLDKDIAVEKIDFLLDNVQFRPYYENQEAVLEEVIAIIQSQQVQTAVRQLKSPPVFQSKFGYDQGWRRTHRDSAKTEPLTPYGLVAEERYAEARVYIELGFDKEAITPLTIAADEGYKPAQFELGNCYRTGYGTAKDQKKACWYYQLAAEQGHCESQFLLGFQCLCDKDIPNARKWFALAAAQGHAEAAEKLRFIGKIAISDVPNQAVDMVSEVHKGLSDGTSLERRSGEESGLYIELWIPDSGDEFEELAQKVCMYHYGENFSRYGRSGQAQYGIDLYTPGYKICVQCKNYQGNNAPRELIDAINRDYRTAVERFYPKGMRKFVVATTARRDTRVQDLIENIRAEVPEDLDIQILFLEDIRGILRKEPDLLRYHKKVRYGV